MKKLFLLISIFILCLTACSSSGTDELKEFPENLMLECEIPSDYPETLNIYDVSNFHDFNEDEILNIFYGDTEYTYIGEDGFGKRFESVETIKEMQKTILISNNSIEISCFIYMDSASYNDPSFFDDLEELIPVEEAETYIMEVVNSCMNLDDESIKVTESQYNAENKEYIFAFEELLDGIPICDDDVYYRIGSPIIEVKYNNSVVYSIGCYAMRTINKTISEITLTSVNDVLNVLIDMYNNNLNLYDSYIEEIELNYVLQLKEAGNYDNLIAVPAWVITLRHETDEYTDYEFIVINAETAEIINTKEEIPWGDS